MAGVTEIETYEAEIYQLEITDPVIGGENGLSNLQAKQLANRTNWLKNNKQDKDALLTAIAALTTAADKLFYATGADTFALTTLTAFARTLLDDADAAAMRATLDIFNKSEVGSAISTAVSALVASSPAALDTLNELASALGNDTNFATTMTNALASKQPIDATLTALAALVTAADKMIYSTGSNTFALTTLTAFARTLLDDTDAAAMRSTIGALGSLVANDANVKTALNAGGTAPIYACRAWVFFNGENTAQINGSGNVSSVTDGGVGKYTMNFTTAIGDTGYSAVGSCGETTGLNCIPPNVYAYATTSISFSINQGSNNALVDPAYVNLAIFR